MGGFGALFDLRAAGFHDPVLVAATDGVGTKLKVAIDTGHHATVGIDLVAMCVNDLIVQGAEPLFFLDYFATGTLDVASARLVVAGIAEGCRQAGCALIGGETAEMPGMYKAGDYDLAGFAVGAAERGTLIDGRTAVVGDVIIGIASSGLHSNGYSLVRKIVERSGLTYDSAAPFEPAVSLAEALLRPTRIYVKALLPLIRAGHAKALAHITGGGFWENIPRVLSSPLAAHIDAAAIPLPPLFQWLAKTGGVTPHEMARTFNCGIGMIVVVAENQATAALARLRDGGEQAWVIGRLVNRQSGGEGVLIPGLARAWG